MPRFAAGLLAGVVPLAWMAALPPAWLSVVLAVPAAWLLWRRRALVLAGVLLGSALALAVAHSTVDNGLAVALEGRDLLVTGAVAELPVDRGRRTRFRFTITEAQLDGRTVAVPTRVRLNWYGKRPELVPGDRWRLTVRMERGRGFANPGTFDYGLWLFRQGIGATGYVREPGSAVRLAQGGPGLDRARYRLRTLLYDALDGLPHDGVLLALALGDRQRIEASGWDALRATGTTHLVAISGLHIGLVALVGYQFGAVLWWCVVPARRRIARPVLQAWIGLAGAAVYAALAGFSLPTLRALLMLAVGLAAIVLRRRARPLEGLATAMVAVLLLDPLAPLGASFWLSFGAVAAILLLLAGRLGPAGRARRWLHLQFGIAVALTPLLTGFFGQASLIAPLANLVAIPWVSALVVPPTLVGTALAPLWPDAASAVLAVADGLLEPLWRLLTWLAAWPLAEWHAPRPPVWLAALAVAGAGLLLAPRGLPGRGAGGLALLPLLLWSPSRPEPGGVWLDLLDVGQGLAAVVRTSSHTLVYDTGARFSRSFDAGSAVVVPFLRAQGVGRIDGLVISHLDNDHAGGRGPVLRAMDPRAVWSSAPRELRGSGARLCARGHRWRWDGVEFRFLHPAPDDVVHGNNASCVLRIDALGGSLLLPGDIEAKAEARLLRRETALAVDVVVAPHHGSAGSSTPDFVRAVGADWVLYPVGYRNRWDFPRPEVVTRWRPAGWAATHCAGAIAVRVHPARGVTPPRGYRQQAPRFWQAGCAGRGKSGNMRAVVPPAATVEDGG